MDEVKKMKKTKEWQKILAHCPFCGRKGRYDNGLICDHCDTKFYYIEKRQVGERETVMRVTNKY